MEITITKDEFRKAVNKANEEYLNISVENEDAKNNPTLSFVLGLQNITFGEVLAKNLFGEE